MPPHILEANDDKLTKKAYILTFCVEEDESRLFEDKIIYIYIKQNKNNVKSRKIGTCSRSARFLEARWEKYETSRLTLSFRNVFNLYDFIDTVDKTFKK